ncbi:MAG: cytochrome c biogenesis protein CcdA [Flavobacteriaceae bacterium]|nr:cytochrome c biogenesis protein CcdA [Flavobacteriaceae bacterium]
MKKLSLLISLLLVLFYSNAQETPLIGGQALGEIKNPLEWEGSIKKISDTDYELSLMGYIDDNWHVYSQHTPEDFENGLGPIPLFIDFKKLEEDYALAGSLEESETHREYSETWGFDEIYFKEIVILKQKVTLNNPAVKVIKSILYYQVCIDVCLNEERYVVFDLVTNKVVFIDNYDDWDAYIAKEKGKTQVEEAKKDDDSSSSESKGLWGIFFIAFLSGFAALLTPCVFPMIPLTVSFFTKQSKNRAAGIKNAIMYGVFIVVIYVLLGSVIVGIFGADSLNALSTNVWFNIIFFLLLVVFAVSFLGAFEITLPQSWSNKVDSQADRGGIVGIFFMALALAIVSFSCTGPIVGTLLVESASKGGIAPIVGMLGFSLAIALPFALFAMFPGWMNSLPKSGGWLNTVKVFLGFLELALAFKFLSNADLVLQLHWIEREMFLAIWIAIFGTLAFYLFGKIKLPHDSNENNISVGRLCLGLVVLAFTIYLIPGIWGAPLKLISGFPPPLNYSEAPYGVGYTKLSNGGGLSSEGIMPNGSELGPHDIIAFNDYETGLAYAKKVNKPVLIDFTGYACVNCRKMEERVWASPHILGILNRDIVLISLYVDDKRLLPENEQYTSETTGKRIRSIGNRWSDFQIKNYQANAQPYYVLMSLAEENLNSPIGYTPDIEEYKEWLVEGIDNFK